MVIGIGQDVRILKGYYPYEFHQLDLQPNEVLMRNPQNDVILEDDFQQELYNETHYVTDKEFGKKMERMGFTRVTL